MAIQVTSRKFRQKQKTFFDLADKREKIIIRQGNRKSYTLSPVDDTDPFFTPDMLKQIDRALEQAKEGKVKKFNNKTDLNKFLDEL